jgi:hypothetical protein
MYSTRPIHWNIKSAPASPGRSFAGPALYVCRLLGGLVIKKMGYLRRKLTTYCTSSLGLIEKFYLLKNSFSTSELFHKFDLRPNFEHVVKHFDANISAYFYRKLISSDSSIVVI